jgi:hypothetical protein
MNKHERSEMSGERSDLQPLRRAVCEISGERSDLQPLRRAVCELQPHRRGGY